MLKATFQYSLLLLLAFCLTFKGSLGQCNQADPIKAALHRVILVSDISDTIITVMVSLMQQWQQRNAYYYFTLLLPPCLLQKDNYIPAVSSQEKETEFFRLWEYLGALKSLKERMESLYTLTEVRERAQLLAIQTVSEKVMDTACQLVSNE